MWGHYNGLNFLIYCFWTVTIFVLDILGVLAHTWDGFSGVFHWSGERSGTKESCSTPTTVVDGTQRHFSFISFRVFRKPDVIHHFWKSLIINTVVVGFSGVFLRSQDWGLLLIWCVVREKRSHYSRPLRGLRNKTRFDSRSSTSVSVPCVFRVLRGISKRWTLSELLRKKEDWSTFCLNVFLYTTEEVRSSCHSNHLMYLLEGFTEFKGPLRGSRNICIHKS